jgi:radical SAM superfamily enzyme YgiQ (UPF0313 family)
MYVAATLEAAGHAPVILDALMENYDEERTVEEVAKIDPEIIGLRCWTSNYHRVLLLCRMLKERLPGRPIVIGGPHPSMHALETVSDPNVDYIVNGEGEIATVELVNLLAEVKDPVVLSERLALVQSIGYKKLAADGSRQPVITAKRAQVPDLDSLPYPARHLVDMKRYRGGPQHAKQHPSTTMICSRGCPFSCTFCDAIAIWTRKYRMRSPANVVAEIRFLHDTYGIKDISFWDDLWGLNRKWSLEFCDLLKKENMGITWSCECRVDTVKPDILKIWADAGCWCIFYGLESMDEEILEAINKETTLPQIHEAIQWTKDAGIEIRGNFIVGLPKESPEKIRKMFKEICKLDIDYIKFNILTPYPGTPLYAQVKSGQWGHFVEDWNHLTGYYATFYPYGYKSAKELEEMQKWLHKRYYFRPAYVIPRLLKMRKLSDFGKYWSGVKALLRDQAIWWPKPNKDVITTSHG